MKRVSPRGLTAAPSYWLHAARVARTTQGPSDSQGEPMEAQQRRPTESRELPETGQNEAGERRVTALKTAGVWRAVTFF